MLLEIEKNEDVKEPFMNSTDNLGTDDYEFDNVDPKVFEDPTLLVKWLKREK